ncbi:MAG: SIMPL domain-containing protein [Novosphingobium sp.]|nr:SIMPL domain-containing protein [Novosphingobium sp.]
MIRYALPLLAATALASPAMAAEVQIAASGPVVELNVSETVKAKPDIATVGAGVSTRAPTAVAAMQQNARAMDAVIAKIKALGIAKEDIQTTGINLNAQYDYDRTAQQQVFRGYQASNSVSVILRDVPKVGQVLDALVAAGATDINGPSFSIDDDTAAKAQARKAAMEHARAQAMEYARMAGYSGVRLLEVSESIGHTGPVPMLRMAADAVAAAPPTPVEPGLVGTGVTVSVKYEMTR